MTALVPRVLYVIGAFLVGSSLRVTAAASGTWTSNGPEGAYVLALAADPSNPSTVYAATGRLYKSVDSGSRWTAMNLQENFDLVLPTSAPSIVYATRIYEVDGPFYRTDDGGESWVQATTPPERLSSLAVDPKEPRTLYAVTASGLFRSTTGGNGWDAVSNTTAAPWDAWDRRGGQVAIAVDPGDSSVLYAAFTDTRPTSVYRSADRGATWNPTNLHDPAYGLMFDPRDGSRLYALTTAGLQVTTNRGESWRRLATYHPNVSHLAIDPADSNILYIVAEGLVFYSTNGGETTTPVFNGNFGGTNLKIVSSGSSVAVVGSERGISRTEDGGRVWEESNAGLREMSLGSLAVDPTNPAHVFASNWTGIFETQDGGASWSGRLPGSPHASVVVIDPSDSSTMYTGGLGLHKSTDGGRTWVVKSPTDNGALVNSIADLLIDWDDPRRIYASSGSVYRSRDGAETWQRVMTPDDDYYSWGYYYYPTPPTVTTLAAAPSDINTLYAGGWEGGGFLYRSTDGGDTWTDLKNGFQVLSLEVDSCDPRILHAGSSFGVYRTNDGGGTWSLGSIPANSDDPYFPFRPFVHAFARDPRHSSSVFAGTSHGLFWSNDHGATWARFDPPLDEDVVSLALDPSGRFLYAGTQRGVFTLERTFEQCRDGPDWLCLIGAKFQLTVTALHPRTGAPIEGRAIEEGDGFGYFSFPDVTGDPNFPEVFVKMLDARGAPPPYGGHAWVFHSSLTDLDYTLTVRETETGRVRTYSAADSAPLTCGTADTSAFVRACEVEDSSSSIPGTRLAAGSGAELSLLGGRFRATIRATDPRTGRIAEGAAIPRADGFGYFSLPGFTGDPSFPEVFVKMVDGRAQPGGSYWVFHTGLTDLEYTLTVTDQVTGAVRTYVRAAADGTRLCGSADTTAFRDP
jgi:photosystem II stability/assembly factor-like uncharacterized protein